MLNIVLRLLAFVIYEGRFVYWIIASRRTQKRKPAEKPDTLARYIGKYITFALEFFIGLQLLNILQILPILGNIIYLQLVGFILLLSGTIICIVSRLQLGTNWTHGSEYQVKKQHELVTSGLYAIIRHPIYLGYFLSYIGAEMVAGSYLFISFFAFLLVMSLQAKREEKILLAHFGEKYKTYIQKTKLLIPFVL